MERSFWHDFCNGAKVRSADRESGASHIGQVSSTLMKRVISEASLLPVLIFIYYCDMSWCFSL